MQPHTSGSILINAPITYVWKELWENFLEDSDITQGTNITKKKATEIHRSISKENLNYRDILTKHEKEKTLKACVVDGDLTGEYTYEIEQSPKGEVVLKIESSIIDIAKRPFPAKEHIDKELIFHK